MLLLHTNEGIYYNRPLETAISLRNQMYGDWRISLGMKINYSVQRKTTYVYTYEMWGLQNYFGLLRQIYIYENSYQVFVAIFKEKSERILDLLSIPQSRGEMPKRLGGVIGCKYKTSSWHLNGFPYGGSNIAGSTV